MASGGSQRSGGAGAGGNTGGASAGAVGPADASSSGATGTGRTTCSGWTSDAWRALPAVNAPSVREEPWVIPTQDGMLVFGGYFHDGTANDPFLDDGAFYRLCSDTWTGMTTLNVPHAITDTVAIRPPGHWTGAELLVWGGANTISPAGEYLEGRSVSFATRYDSVRDAWSTLNRDGEPTAREYAVDIWTGDKLLIWGGVAQSGDKAWENHQDGALYDPAADRWTAMSTASAPSGRLASQRYVWTGEKLIVWGGVKFVPGGGFNPSYESLTDGGIYDPSKDAWTPIATSGAPTSGSADLVWTGQRMIALGRLDGYTTPGKIEFDAASFDPEANVWSPMSAPSPSIADTVEQAQRKLVWTGKELAVFGVGVTAGVGTPVLLLYNPEKDSWSRADMPIQPRYFNWQSAFAIDGKVVVVGPGTPTKDVRGADHESTLIAVFDPESRTWSELPLLENRTRPFVVALDGALLAYAGTHIYTDLDAPNPCQGSTGPCDPITPTVRELLSDGVGIAF
jgi:hypothetical protein